MLTLFFMLETVKNRPEWYRGSLKEYEHLLPVPGTQVHGDDILVHVSHLPLIVPGYYRANTPDTLVASHTHLDEWTQKTLRAYQLNAVEFIRRRRGTILADQMRLGKTPTCVAAHSPAYGAMVVVGPLATRHVWVDWFKRRFPNVTPAVLEGQTLDVAKLKSSPLVFLHYELLQYWQTVGEIDIDLVVFDEGHRLSNRKSRLYQSAILLASQARRVVVSTGTPLWNKPEGLYSLLMITTPGAWGNYKDYSSRYCLHEATPILLSDGSYKAAREIVVGDSLIGWTWRHQRTVHETTVQAVWARVAPCAKITLASGKQVICTHDHHWYIHAKRRVARQYRALYGEKRRKQWRRPLKHLYRVNVPSVVALPETAEYKLGYIRGLLDGDGHVKKNTKDGYTCTISANEDQHLRVAQGYAEDLGLVGTTLKLQRCGMWLLGFWRKVHYITLTAERLSSTEFLRGWLAGVWDAEGTGDYIAQYAEVNPDHYKFLQAALQHFSFDFRSDPKGIGIRGGGGETFRLLALIRPKLQRKLRWFWQHAGNGFRFKANPDPIVSIEEIGLQSVVSIQTESGNYIANGFASKNCSGQPGPYGWTTGQPSYVDELRDRLKEVMIRRCWTDVRAELPAVTRTVEMVEIDIDQQIELEKLAASLRSVEKLNTTVGEIARLRGLLGSLKVETAGELALVMEQDEPVVLWCWHKEIAKALMARLSDIEDETAFMITGDTPPGKREATLDLWRQTNAPLILTLGVGQAGIDLSHAKRAIFVEVDWTPAVMAQAEMRTYSPDRAMDIVYVVAEHEIDRKLVGALVRKCRQAERLGTPAADTAIDTLQEALGDEELDLLDILESD